MFQTAEDRYLLPDYVRGYSVQFYAKFPPLCAQNDPTHFHCPSDQLTQNREWDQRQYNKSPIILFEMQPANA